MPLPTAKAIEIVAFVDGDSIDPIRIGDFLCGYRPPAGDRAQEGGTNSACLRRLPAVVHNLQNRRRHGRGSVDCVVLRRIAVAV